MRQILIGFLQYTAWRVETPQMFGRLHIVLLAIITIASVITAMWAKRYRRKAQHKAVRLLSVCGWILAAMEVYKQLFLYFIVNDCVYDWWYFPFQLCSVPMYMCILLPSLKRTGTVRRSFLTFMTGFTFISAVAALIYPQDYMRSYVTLTVHGFLWHGILLFISLTIAFAGMSDLSARGIARSVWLFLALCVIAVGINIYAEPIMARAHSTGLLANSYAAMFYLNPYHISPQLLVSAIQKSAGIPVGLALYVLVIIIASVAACILFRRLSANED